MNVEKILNELHSEGMKEIVKTVAEIMNRVEKESLDLDRAHLELVGCKHILQSFALSLARETLLKQQKVFSPTVLNGKLIHKK